MKHITCILNWLMNAFTNEMKWRSFSTLMHWMWNTPLASGVSKLFIAVDFLHSYIQNPSKWWVKNARQFGWCDGRHWPSLAVTDEDYDNYFSWIIILLFKKFNSVRFPRERANLELIWWLNVLLLNSEQTRLRMKDPIWQSTLRLCYCISILNGVIYS